MKKLFLSALLKDKKWHFDIVLMLAELLFFAAVMTHIAVSLTNGFITLGVLSSRETKKKIDRVIYVIGALGFVIAAYAVVKVQIVMFLTK